jgi:hypothetical protein
VHYLIVILNQDQTTVLLWYKLLNQSASLQSYVDFLKIVCNVTISKSTVCRELKKLGFSYKNMKYYSMSRDENDRINYWCNGPEYLPRRGMLNVNYLEIVDIDESGYYTDAANRKKGHSGKGIPARKSDRSR